MPRSPLVPEPAELFAEQRRLGLRHAADALFPGSPVTAVRFRILDGLEVAGRGRHWRPVNRAGLAETRDAWLAVQGVDRQCVRSLFARYDRILGVDPMGLRRVALYELVGLLQRHPRGPVTEAAQELGADPAEAEALALGARLEPRRTDQLRESAELIVDAWRANRLRRAQEYADRLGDPGGDQRLARFLRRINQRTDEVSALLAEGVRLERAGEPAAAAAVRLRAARTAVDEPAAVEALLRTASAGAVTARVLADSGIRVDWSGGVAPGPYRVLRGRPGNWTELADATDRTRLTDTTAPVGEYIRYAVLPLDGPGSPRIREVPAVSARVRYAPEVADPQLTDGRGRVTARWRIPPGARGVLVERQAGKPVAVAADRDGFTEAHLAPREHRYTIRCRYRTATGAETTSAGITVRATVHRWPEPITRLDVATGERLGSIVVTWTGGDGAELRLVDLAGPLPAQGADVLVKDLPAEVAWERAPQGRGLELRPPRGTRARLTAVSVLGDRACVGPSASIELASAVENLQVRRDVPDQVRVTFDWPGDADCVQVSWEQSGEAHHKTVTKSAYRTRGGLQLTVATAGARFHAAPVTLDDADVVIPAPAGAPALLPPYLAVSYDLVKPGWRAGRRRRVIVRTEYAGTVGADSAPDLPEFVLVARAGQRMSRPRHAMDGTTLLRLSGAEIGRSGGRGGRLVERDIDVTVPGEEPPYSLRAFLLGPRADSAQLEEPPHERLVVR